MAMPVAPPPVRSPRKKTVKVSRLLLWPSPTEDVSAQALFWPQVEPDRESPATTAASTSANPA